jgi:type I restriction enzyme, S subunit
MWKTVNLGDIADVSAGNSAPQDKFLFEGGTHPFVRTSDVGKIKIGTLSDSNDKLNEKGITKLKLFRRGTILFPKSGASTLLNHRVILDIDAYVSSHLATIKSKLEVVSDNYLWYFLQTIDAAELVAVSAYPSLNIETIQSISVALPPLAEQERIVAKLDAAFAEIDQAIEVASRKQKQCEQLADSALDEIVDLEGETVTLAGVCSIDAALVSPTEKPYLQQKNVGAGNIIKFSNDLIDVMTAQEEELTSGKYPFDTSSVLYSKIRPYLRKVHLPKFNGICSADIYPLVPVKEKLTREFLFCLLLSNHFTNYAIAGSARAGMPKVNRNHLFAYQLSLPSLSLQREFSNRMEQILNQTRNLIRLYQSQINELMNLKSAILTKELQSSEAA